MGLAFFTSGIGEQDKHRIRTQEKFVFAQCVLAFGNQTAMEPENSSLIVGNTYPYSEQDWLEDLELASANELDGFVLNIGVEEWQKDRVLDCFKASERLLNSNEFKLLLSFDMTSIPGHSENDITHFVSYLSSLASHPRLFRHPHSGRVVISTFSGENCHFGKDCLDKGWSHLKQELSVVSPVDLVPAFFTDPAQSNCLESIDGIFNWNGCWPVHLTPSHPQREIQLETDFHYLRLLGAGQYLMAAVSPWFFTHYGPGTWNKNWIYRADDWLFVRRWEQLIEMRDSINFVQVISWNDYGESHYIGPGTQPNSQAWVDGYPHEAWLRLNSFFARAFKDGTYPQIIRDVIYVWARPHPKDAIANEEVPRPDNWQLTDDLMWIVLFTTAPATIRIHTSDSETDVRQVDVGKGMTRVSSPLMVGGGIKVVMLRNGIVTAECAPIGYRFEAWPGVYNYNVFVAMSE